ncbi:hypothetical protein [Alcanivorax sp.]
MQLAVRPFPVAHPPVSTGIWSPAPRSAARLTTAFADDGKKPLAQEPIP